MKMRYFLELAYNGTRFFGWQRQPKQISVQQRIEEAISTILRTPTNIVGCGRTDTGVHASEYYAHFDAAQPLPERFLHSLNGILRHDVVVYRVLPVAADAHARFDAKSRSYRYYLSLRRNPFRQETAYHYPLSELLDLDKMQAAAQLLLDYQHFDTFCKTNTDVKTKICQLTRSEWVYAPEEHQLIYHVSANRFLRGMIRLIVGMCINIGRDKYPLEEVKEALEAQKSLKHAWSVPAQGLFLCDIKYDFLKKNP